MAWQQAYETLTDQRQSLESARTALLAAWPVTPGSAAESFFDQIDALTQSMSATAETAVNGHGALTGIVTAVDDATAKVDTLHQSWRQNQATIGDVVAADDWTQPLNNQAHVVMGQADAAIAEHVTQLTPPVPYTAGVLRDILVPMSSPRGISAGTTTRTASEGQPGKPTLRSHMDGTPVLATSNASSMPGNPVGTRTSNSAADGTRAQVLMPGGPNGIANGSGHIAFDVAPIGKALARENHPPTAQAVESDLADSGVARSADQIASGQDSGAVERALSADSAEVGRPGIAAARPEQLIGRSLGTGDFTSQVPAELRSTPSPGAGAGSQPLPYAGMLMSGTNASGVGTQRRRSDVRGVTEWPLPTGGRSILEPRPKIDLLHDPGPGVIGIDL
jgi:hypothetical protein